MLFVALNEAAARGELILADGGMLRFHRRRDGVVTIREIVVLPERRRAGVGRGLVDRVAALNPGAVLRATCPGEYEANAFWRSLGFTIVAYKPPGGRLAVWERRPNSSTAPTGTPSSPASR